jgi:hypothetical protein
MVTGGERGPADCLSGQSYAAITSNKAPAMFACAVPLEGINCGIGVTNARGNSARTLVVFQSRSGRPDDHDGAVGLERRPLAD